MKNNRILSVFCISLLVMGLSTCKKTEDPTPEPEPERFVRITESNVSIGAGKSYTVTASFDSKETENQNFTWSILDPAIASITKIDNSKATITGIKAGSTTIKIKSDDGKLEASSSLQVIGFVVIDESTVAIDMGESYEITASFDSEATASQNFTWSIQDPSIASITKIDNSKATITGIKAGSTTIKIKSDDGKFEASSNLQVRSIFKLSRPVFIDFGGAFAAPAPYNVFSNCAAGSSLQNLKDDQGKDTDYTITVSSPGFNPFVIERYHPNNLGIPWQASNDVFFNDGINVASSGFVISNLNKSQKYSFYIYGAIADPGPTETEYRVAGKNEKTVFLDTKYNEDNLATVTGITPNDDGQIVITLKAGPNNTQWALYYGINAMIMTPDEYNLTFPLPVEENNFDLKRPVFIDFSGIDRPAEPWNILGGRFIGNILPNMKDDEGTNTEYAISVSHDADFGEFARGYEYGNAFGFPWQVQNDVFFNDGIHVETTGLIISYLKKSQNYTLYFYSHINDPDVEVEYQVTGKNEKTVLFNISFNHDKLVVVENITPDDKGQIIIKLRPGPNNMQWAKFYGVNALIITPEGFNLYGMLPL